MTQPKNNCNLTAERVRSLLHYNPHTGAWTWLVSRGPVKAGSRAGSRDRHGYLQIYIDGRSYPSNRLAWLYMTGAWPVNLVDHEDLDKTNDRWCNLREATYSQNNSNVIARRHNKCGYKGVEKYGRRFRSRIRVNTQIIELGWHDSPEEAHAAYCAAANDHRGEFARVA